MNQLKEDCGDTQRQKIMLKTSLDKQQRELQNLKRRCNSLQDQVEEAEEARVEEQRQAEQMINVERKRARS